MEKNLQPLRSEEVDHCEIYWLADGAVEMTISGRPVVECHLDFVETAGFDAGVSG